MTVSEHSSTPHPARMPGTPDVVMLGTTPAASSLYASACMLGARIDTRRVAGDPAVAALAAHAGLIFIFRYGVVVTIATKPGPPEGLHAALLDHVIEPTTVLETENARLSVSPSGGERIAKDGQILLAETSEERLLLVATVLARSLVLARDETMVSEAFDRIGPLVTDLRVNGRARSPIKPVMQLVGNAVSARHRVLATVQANERPDLLWDPPELDLLYHRLEAEYELSERAGVLERKFGALGDFTEVLLDIVQDKRAVRLETAIIGLIAFEILLTLFTMATSLT